MAVLAGFPFVVRSWGLLLDCASGARCSVDTRRVENLGVWRDMGKKIRQQRQMSCLRRRYPQEGEEAQCALAWHDRGTGDLLMNIHHHAYTPKHPILVTDQGVS
jgi:hypothetical protein